MLELVQRSKSNGFRLKDSSSNLGKTRPRWTESRSFKVVHLPKDSCCPTARKMIFERTKWRRKLSFLVISMLLVLCCASGVESLKAYPAQVVRDVQKLKFSESPYLITGNVVIEREGEMEIEPGVELRFLSGIGFTVRGILKAEGRMNSVIRFTRSDDTSGTDIRVPSDIRLIDGPSIHEGRLQLFFKGKWRSVCTNSRNWTKTDFEVACRQLGFNGGSFSRWHERNNDSSQLSYEMPSCQYGMGSLMSCNWATRQLGSGVCDLHYDIGIHCEPQSIQPLQHWSGIRFESAAYNVFDGIKVSRSALRHVEIYYAGWNATSNFTSALEAYGVPPRITHVTVKWSAFTGLNFTNPQAEVAVADSLIADNRGYGVFVNTSHGLMQMYNSTVLANGADGIRYVFHNVTQPLFNRDAQDFCSLLDRGMTQLYPLTINALQEKNNSPNSKTCQKAFAVNSRDPRVLTIHFPYFESSAEHGGEIEVRDGAYPNSPLLLRFNIRNGTRPQSVTSTGTTIWIRFAPAAQAYVIASMEIFAMEDKAYDLNVTHSTIKENNGRGIVVENMRSMVHIFASRVVNNKHQAGVHVLGGVGDVNVTRTEISDNLGDGVNISYAGGRRNITACNVMRNELRGIAVWLNESSRHVPANQYTVVAYSTIIRNGGVGFLVGNFCRPATVNITYTTFQEGNDAGLKIDSCWRELDALPNEPPALTLYLTHSKFIRHKSKAAFIISPAVNLKAFIAYNQFLENGQGALLIRNPNNMELLETLPVDISVIENIFNENRGPFVAAIGLSQYSLVQKLEFTRNELRKNVAAEPFPHLVPRYSVAAVVTVSSSNVLISRNLFENPDSKFDVGSHLANHYATINATLCYFGKYSAYEGLKVYNRVFDSKDRYDLASIEVTPYLLVAYKDEMKHISGDESNQLVVDFKPDDTPFKLGGTVYGRQELAEGVYTVWRDIYVRGKSELVLSRKTTLKFAPSVGLMVQGKLTVQGEKGDHDQQVLFTLDEDATVQGPVVEPPIRLVGGQSAGDFVDGLLQVRIDDRWGSVCSYGWNKYSAALACASLGLVLNPYDWQMARGRLNLAEGLAGAEELPILLSNVRCTECDVDLLGCQSERGTDFENSCIHEQDVGLRCYRQTWAGVRLGLMSEPSVIRAARIERAGIHNAATNKFRPALQIDFNRHRLEDVTVSRNLHTGVGSIFNDYYSDFLTARRMTGCILEANLAHGLVTSTSGLTVDNCLVRSNRQHGILYNPSLDHSEQRELGQWLDRSAGEVVILTPGGTVPDTHLDRGNAVYVVMDGRIPAQGNEVTLRLKTDSTNVLGMQILSQVHNGTNETVTVDDGRAGDPPDRVWDLQVNELDFPTVSRTNEILIKYVRRQQQGHGDPILYVTALERRPQEPLTGPTPMLRLWNTELKQNQGAGFASVHYNHQVGPLEQRRLRVRNESVEVLGCRFTGNHRAALLVDSPFHEILEAPLANITYTINRTTVIANERAGIVQDSQDIYASNNLFHWLLADNRFQENQRGGLEVSLPYAWQYDRQKTHSIFMKNNTFQDNRNLAIVVDGHFVRLEARFNRFTENFCYRGLLQVKGMEKEILIEDNVFDSNRCEFIVEFFADSHTEKFGQVEAHFRKNYLRSNLYGMNDTVLVSPSMAPTYQPRSYTLGLRGIQKVNVTNNVFSNNTLDYEFLAGIASGSLASHVNARENWWGTTDPREIRRRIFDFDDWNNFAVAEFSPFSQSAFVYGSVVDELIRLGSVDLENLGGRLYNNTYLRRRSAPYIIRSDLTIMPGITLHIEGGVELQFFPSIGILVLGALRAIGAEDNPIRMRPFVREQFSQRWRRQALYSQPPKFSRLCTNRECGYLRQGFMEIFNASTRQWVPICDRYFTEDNAAVVCRELGYQSINSHFLMGTRLDVDPNLLARMVHWPEPRQCTGAEERFVDCPLRFSGFYKPTYPCSHDGKFVFVYCGQPNIAHGSSYWGGIRFAGPTFEPLNTQVYDAANTVLVDNSALEFVDIIGAGILHNEKSPAVLAVSRSPHTFMFVNVSHSASHGISILAPINTMVIYGCRAENNLGIGIHVSVLYGESRNSPISSFVPLKEVPIPHKTFGMVDLCSSDKVLNIENRILLYYKYDHNSADCVKIFSSYGNTRTLGLRFLQFNLLNTTLLSPLPDSIKLFDGDVYGLSDALLLAEITTESLNQQSFFQTTKPSLTVRLHASGGSEKLGFIAEVVTVPTASKALRDRHHNITNCVVERNILGGLEYSNVGEVGPVVSVLNSQFKDNGDGLFGNLSTCNAAVKLDIQNTVRVFVQNNLIQHNQGGLRITADSETSAASMNAFITNNLIYQNEKWEAFKVEGRKTTPFQMVDIFRNTITQNYAPFKDVLSLVKVLSNFTDNFVVNNTGDHVMTVVAFDQASHPDFQVITYNSFWNNWALRWDQRSTIILMGSGQRIEENIFINPYNDFELMLQNLSGALVYNTPDTSRIDATNNWWSYNQTWAVSGRIWDGDDERGLPRVVYQPFYLNNYTLMSGKCQPGWKLIDKTCFIYIGGVMQYEQAEAYCQTINGSIPYVEVSNAYDILGFVSRQQVHYDLRTHNIWVRTLNTPMRGCSSMHGARTFAANCNLRLPVVCESDPDVYLYAGDWTKYNITYAAIGAVAATLLLVLICVLFWLCKSRQKHLEKMERRDSIRASIRSASSRSLGGSTTFGSTELAYRRKMASDDRLSDVKPVKLNDIKAESNGGSIDSIVKSPSRFGSSQLHSSVEDNRSYEVFEARNHQVDYSDYDDKFVTEAVNPLRPGNDDDYFDDTRTTQTPSSSIGYGFDNKCYLETHFTSEETGSRSTNSSILDDPVDLKRVLEAKRDSQASSESRSTPSSSSQDYYKRHLLETEM